MRRLDFLVWPKRRKSPAFIETISTTPCVTARCHISATPAIEWSILPCCERSFAPEGVAMSRKVTTNGGEAHIRIPNWLMDSPPFRRQTPAARSVYLEVHRVYSGRNNGRLSVSVRNASILCGIHKDTAAKAFRDLEEAGLIENMRRGSYSPTTQRMAAEWRLTHLQCHVTGREPYLTRERAFGPQPGAINIKPKTPPHDADGVVLN
jgi:hypothetical protein